MIHEHFIFGYPGFQGDVTLGPFIEEEALETAIGIARHIMSFGIKSVVDPTPNECGRNPKYEKMFFRAAARVQLETGIVILTHTQEGTMGPQQVQLLIDNGADPSRIIIGHMCGNTNPDYHKEVMDQGVRIAFDRFGIQGIAGAPFDHELSIRF